MTPEVGAATLDKKISDFVENSIETDFYLVFRGLLAVQ